MNKTEKVNYLKRVQIASPCKADWDKMDGDERVRHCQLCNLNVFNISEMTTDEAVKLLQNKTGRLCIQLYRRKDGTVITRDCPKGLERVRRAYLRTAAALAGTLAWLGLAAPSFAQGAQVESHLTKGESKIEPHLAGEALPPIMGDLEMGKRDISPTRGSVHVVEDVDIKSDRPITPLAISKKEEEPEKNRLLAAGLMVMVFGALFKLIFGRMRKRSSLWIVGTSFISAFLLIGVIWHCFW